MSDFSNTPRGAGTAHTDQPPFTYYAMSRVEGHSVLFSLAATVDGFRTRYGRRPRCCFTGPREVEALAKDRTTWDEWCIWLIPHERCAGTFQCGDCEPLL